MPGLSLKLIVRVVGWAVVTGVSLAAAVLVGSWVVVHEEFETQIERDCELARRYEDYKSAGYDSDGKNLANGHQIPEALSARILTSCKERCTL